MQLHEAIVAAGMTPPHTLVPGRWMRFPGIGKGRANRAGWCRIISPTLAIYGDWSSNFIATWKDDAHRDDETTRRLLKEAKERERQFAAEQQKRAKSVEVQARRMLELASRDTHPYLIRKGFKYTLGLVRRDLLLIPIHSVDEYPKLISLQTILPDGTKRFLPGGRTKGGIHRLGHTRPGRTALCEGFATALSLQAAMKLLPGPCAVVACFSATNLVTVAPHFPGALVCADNDESRTGEEAAKKTGLRWVMPEVLGEDFNDMHQRVGLIHVVEVLRHAFA